jgi:thiamine-phosphate pyrophosphorylase
MAAASSTDRARLAERLAGVYLLTPDASSVAFAAVVRTVQAALAGGVRAVQYRNKRATAAERLAQARALREATQAHDALLIVNDDVDVAIASNADGVHLGRDDGDIAAARQRLPSGLLCASCYADLDLAQRAVAAGADAIAFGSLFASTTKPDAVHAPLELLRQARRRFPDQRIIGIGGIGATNIERVAAAGAHAAALISAIFEAPDARGAAEALLQQFNRGRTQHDKE